MSWHESRLLLVVLVGLSLPLASRAATRKTPPAKLTVAQIIQRHVAARGGLKAWHGVEAVVWRGRMEVGFADAAARSARYVSSMARSKGARAPTKTAGGSQDIRKQVQVPFVLEMKRPGKSRIEIAVADKTAVQIYDGTNGWLQRPYLNRDDWEPFTAEQARSQHGRWNLDGPLMDHAAEGTRVELVSVEPVEGHDAYKLELTRANGEVRHVWIDAMSFLDVKVEGTPRRMDGKLRSVWVIQRDFRPVQGVKVPFVLETAVDGSPDTHQMVIEKVALNPPLNDARFVKPGT